MSMPAYRPEPLENAYARSNIPRVYEGLPRSPISGIAAETMRELYCHFQRQNASSSFLRDIETAHQTCSSATTTGSYLAMAIFAAHCDSHIRRSRVWHIFKCRLAVLLGAKRSVFESTFTKDADFAQQFTALLDGGRFVGTAFHLGVLTTSERPKSDDEPADLHVAFLPSQPLVQSGLVRLDIVRFGAYARRLILEISDVGKRTRVKLPPPRGTAIERASGETPFTKNLARVERHIRSSGASPSAGVCSEVFRVVRESLAAVDLQLTGNRAASASFGIFCAFLRHWVTPIYLLSPGGFLWSLIDDVVRVPIQ